MLVIALFLISNVLIRLYLTIVTLHDLTNLDETFDISTSGTKNQGYWVPAVLIGGCFQTLPCVSL